MQNVTAFLETLERLCTVASDEKIAEGQAAYMRHQFRFYGIKTPERREIQRDLFQKSLLPSKNDLPALVRVLWEKKERENQYIGQELARKYVRLQEENDVLLFEYMITHKSWWDTVDFIAVNLVGSYFRSFPEKREAITEKWMSSGNIWLQRTTLLFQLKYKGDLDTEFLGKTITQLLGSREFFINKAIGWVLREYSKTDPSWVRRFAAATPLDPLSAREALRLLKDR
ncbi:DNA-7-methylguanine glycosylase [Muriicola jejuensis]|nr:DNA alkylation repair protein [Muriicola jejuensis]SMP12119.1 DNA-7-methylguanine glycosylase [Muriicola jejuensis]